VDENKEFNEGMIQISTLIKYYTFLKYRQSRGIAPLCSHFSEEFEECRI
jgi:hypothetical protein